jgi:transposase
VAVEEAFKTLKGDLSIRPIFHQKERRIEAHIFIAFLTYCLHVTLGHRLKNLAPGLTPTQRAGEILRRANDRRARANHRRTRTYTHARHAT